MIRIKTKGLLTTIIMILSLFSFTACGNNSGGTTKEPPLKDVYDAVVAAYGENYIPEVPMEEESLVIATGINAEDISEFIAETPMFNLSSDTFIAIKAVKGKGVDIEKSMFNYQIWVANESFQYPANLAKAKASKVLRHGDYVFFVMLGASNQAENPTEEEALNFAEEQIKIGTDAIDAMFK